MYKGLVGLIVWGLSACGPTEESFEKTLIEVNCAWVTTCFPAQYASEDSCIEAASREDGGLGLPDGCVFDSAAAGDCLDAYRTAQKEGSCDPTEPLFAPCEEVCREASDGDDTADTAG